MIRGVFFTGLICLVLSLATLAWLVRTPFEMTRLRNALIFQVGTPSDFLWQPGNAPANFNMETMAAPSEFGRFVRASEAAQLNGYQLAFTLAQGLTRGSVTRGNPIQSDTRDTFRRITEANEGYCSDFTQVFNGVALAANLPVREWGMSFDGFSGDGHAFSEVFDRTLGKWVFLDSFNSFYVVDPQSEVPLSVLEFRERLESRDVTLVDGVRFIDREAFGMKNAATAIDYYSRGTSQFFLWFGNDIFSYDNNSLISLVSRFGRSVEQATAILIGAHPKIVVFPAKDSGPSIAKMSLTRNLFVVAFGLGLIALCSFFYSLLRRRDKSSERELQSQ